MKRVREEKDESESTKNSIYRVSVYDRDEDMTSRSRAHQRHESALEHLAQVKREQFEVFEKQWKQMRSSVHGCLVQLSSTWLDFIQQTESFETQILDNSKFSEFTRDETTSLTQKDPQRSKELTSASKGKYIRVPIAVIRSFLDHYEITGKLIRYTPYAAMQHRTDFVPYRMKHRTFHSSPTTRKVKIKPLWCAYITEWTDEILYL